MVRCSGKELDAHAHAVLRWCNWIVNHLNDAFFSKRRRIPVYDARHPPTQHRRPDRSR
jgi:hypothetical protein